MPRVLVDIYSEEGLFLDTLFVNMASAPPPHYEQFAVHSDPSTVGQRWPSYISRMKNMFTGYNITNDAQKRSLLLYYAGPDVSDIFDTLPSQGTTFDEAVTCLTTYFAPKKNTEFERFKFREEKQLPGETVDSYHMRLQQLAKSCEFHNKDDEIKSQIIRGCLSTRLRRRALRQETTLKELLDHARAAELAEVQASSIEKSGTSTSTSESVNKVIHNKNVRKPKQSNDKSKDCYFCGGSYPHSGSCPARNKKCNYCKKTGHFEKCCHSKSRDQGKSHEFGQNKPKSKTTQNTNTKQKSSAYSIDVKYDSNSDEESTEYVWRIGKSNKIPSAEIKFGNHNVSVIIDTGSSINLMGEDVFRNLPDQPNLNNKNLPRVYAYGANKHMKILGKFKIPLNHNEHSLDTTFYVSENPGEVLLSYETSRDLGLINVIRQITCESTEKIVSEFEDRFRDLGKLSDSNAHLHGDETIPGEQNRHVRIPFLLRKPVDKELQRLLDNDVIEPVEGEATPWVSPVHIVRKPRSDQIRITVDMRAPNKAIKRERHIVPTVDDVITSLNGATRFTKLDLNQGYHQVELDESSRKYTVFSTHRGLFRYKRLNFGVNAAAEIFQNKIQRALDGLDGVLNISDDILVFGTNQEEHDQRLRAVFERLREKNLTLNREKCKFNKDSVEFFGHVFSKEGISPDPKKVEALQEAEQPNNSSEVRSFIGLAQYCSRFIADLATKTEPLRQLTRSSTKFVWKEDQQRAFDTVKHNITEHCTNAYFNLESETELLVDASPVGLGAILAQKDEKGEFHIIAMASRALTSVEQRYSQTEREALAIAWGITHFKLYLYANTFKVITDHRPLETLFNNPHAKPSTRIERWLMKIQEYDFIVEYRPGKDNPADYFSRHPVRTPTKSSQEEKVAEEHINFVTAHALPKTVSLEEVIDASKTDVIIQAAMRALHTGRWHEVIKSNPEHESELKRLYLLRSELSANESDLLLRGNRIVIPVSLRTKLVNLAHEGHQGLVRTKNLLRQKVWFSGIDAMTQKIVGECPQCQITTTENNREPLQMSKLPAGPWLELSCDLMDLPNGKYVVILVDDYSRYPMIEILNSATSRAVIPALDNMMSILGIPEKIRTDNGPCFKSSEFSYFAKDLGFKHRKITPCWPRANGEAERMVRTLKKVLRISHTEHVSFKQLLNRFLRNYRATPHPSTGEAPATLMFGRPMRTKLPEVTKITPNPEVIDRDNHQKEIMKMNAESRLKLVRDESYLQLGDTVLLRREGIIRKEMTPYEPEPYQVIAKNGSMVTASRGDHNVTRNSSRFKRVNFELLARDIPPDDIVNVNDSTLENSEPGNPPGGTSLNPPSTDPPPELSPFCELPCQSEPTTTTTPVRSSVESTPPVRPRRSDGTKNLPYYSPVSATAKSPHHLPVAASATRTMNDSKPRVNPLSLFPPTNNHPKRNPTRSRNPPAYLQDFVTW